MVGVYKITNLLNQDSYIGSSKNIEERWKKHLYLYNREGRHYSYHLYRAMRKYGVENFKFEVLELCSEQDRTERERYYFFLINPKYNEMVPRDNRLFSEEKRQEFKDRCKEAWKTKSQDSKNKAFENLKKGHMSQAYMRMVKQRRPVIATRLSDGEQILFASLSDAERAVRVPKSSIHQIISPNHPRKSSKGYTFRYV